MPRPETIRRWTERLRRFAQSGATVPDFCRAEGVSSAAFYQWKRKLSHEPLQPAAAFVPVVLADRRSPAAPTRQKSSSSPPQSKTTIKLPGGIRIQIEVPTQASRDTEDAQA